MPGKQDRRGISRQWFRHGERDPQGAKLVFQYGGSTETVGVLAQQAVEKYLKGYLLAQGWRLRKTHDLEALLTQALSYDKAFEEFLELSRVLSAAYVESRYPPGQPREYTREEIAAIMAQAEKLISKIKEAVG